MSEAQAFEPVQVKTTLLLRLLVFSFAHGAVMRCADVRRRGLKVMPGAAKPWMEARTTHNHLAKSKKTHTS